MPISGMPLSLEYLAQALEMSRQKVQTIVEDLEKRKTFMYRYNSEAINWAYPVTVDKTPHHITFSTGEEVNAAWAIDAIATPFVQVKLREQWMSFIINSKCAQADLPIQIKIDSDLQITQVEEGANPFIFVPSINLAQTKAPNIIDIFWRRSIFLWSEENLKQHRSVNADIPGVYLTLKQSIAITPIAQSALFGF